MYVDDAWNALAAHIWPPKPDQRETLRTQIVRTDHGEFLTVLRHGEQCAMIKYDTGELWMTSYTGVTECSHGSSKDAAIDEATEWLIDRASQQTDGTPTKSAPIIDKLD